MFYIIALIIFGVLFMVAEIVLLPGVSIGAILSLASYGGAIYLSYTNYGLATAIIVFVVVLLLSAIATVVSLRAKTWQRFSLKQQLESTSMPSPEDTLKKGAQGTTLSRLSPMGKIEVNGSIYEAKSLDAYIDPHEAVEVVGFENFSVIVKKI